MKIVTLYFILLPFLLAISIYFVKIKQIELHYKSQIALYAITLVIILYFEIMLRISGGFLYYKEFSQMNEYIMLLYLMIHIMIAVIAIVLWSYTLITTYKSHKNNSLDTSRHKKLGKLTFVLLTLSCIMGTGMYYMLFVYI